MNDMRTFLVPIRVKITAAFERKVDARSFEEAIACAEELEIEDLADDQEFRYNAYIDHFFVDKHLIEED